MLSSAAVHPTLPASDYERAKKFYVEKLGLTIAQDNLYGAMLACGDGTSVFVYPSASAGTNKATAAEWTVNDLMAEVTELKSKGITFEEYDMPELKTVDGIATMGNDKAAWFKDSEGNILALSQRG